MTSGWLTLFLESDFSGTLDICLKNGPSFANSAHETRVELIHLKLDMLSKFTFWLGDGFILVARRKSFSCLASLSAFLMYMSLLDDLPGQPGVGVFVSSPGVPADESIFLDSFKRIRLSLPSSSSRVRPIVF